MDFKRAATKKYVENFLTDYLFLDAQNISNVLQDFQIGHLRLFSSTKPTMKFCPLKELCDNGDHLFTNDDFDG
jgi:hypothetical protein